MKLCRSIGCIRRIKHLLPRKILVNLYYSLILPHIDYCYTAWGSCSKTNLNIIQRLQNKYARLVLNADWYTSQCFLMTTLNWQTVEHRIKYQYCLLVFKVLNNLAPPYLEPLISRFNPSYCTRYSLNSSLSIPHPKTDYKKRPFSYTGSSLYNRLPITVQQSHSLHAFKKNCSRYIAMLWKSYPLLLKKKSSTCTCIILLLIRIDNTTSQMFSLPIQLCYINFTIINW